MRIRDGKISDTGSGMEKFVSGINIPDQQHWFLQKNIKFLATKLQTLLMLCRHRWESYAKLPNLREDPSDDSGIENVDYC
jgi:hypothetical protein